MPSIPASDTNIDDTRPKGGGLQTSPGATSQAHTRAQGDAPATSADHAETIATFNEAGVRSAQANWLDGLNNLLYAPDTGYLHQRGAAAVGGYQPLQQAIGKLNQQAQDSLADDHQRRIFTDATASIINAAQARIQQHAQSQSRVYDADASRARALSARDLAVNAWNPAPGADNSNYRQGAAILHNELENQFRHTWGDPASADNKTLWNHFLQHGPNGDDGIASLSTGVVNRLLANDQPHDAKNFLDEVQHTLPAPTRDKLSQFVTAAVDQHAGTSAAFQAQAVSNDPAAQQQKLDALHNGGHISDEAHAIAIHKIQADQAAKAAAQQQNDTRILKKVWALKNANPNAAITDLPSADYAYLKSRGLDVNALAILQSHPATDDPGLFNQLHRMASQDPVRFGKQNLLAQSGKLSRAHMQTLLGLQDAVNKQEPQAIQRSKNIDMTVKALMRDVQSASPENASANTGADNHASEDQADTLAAGLRDHLIAAQQSDPKITLDDLHGTGASFLKDAYLYGLDGDGSSAPIDAQQARNRALLGPFDSSASSAGSEAVQASSKEAVAEKDKPAKQITARTSGAAAKPSQVPEVDTRIRLDPSELQAADGVPATHTAPASATGKEVEFAVTHPLEAWHIGTAGGLPHDISSNASRFATMGTAPGKGHLQTLTKGYKGMTGESNAFRHALWQAEITNRYGYPDAEQAGNSHEDDPLPDLMQREFPLPDPKLKKEYTAAWQRADTVLDLLNNPIGRFLGGSAPDGAGMRNLAGKVLDYYHERGLWNAVPEGGRLMVKKIKLSDDKYLQLKDALQRKDDNGEWVKK